MIGERSFERNHCSDKLIIYRIFMTTSGLTTASQSFYGSFHTCCTGDHQKIVHLLSNFHNLIILRYDLATFTKLIKIIYDLLIKLRINQYQLVNY